MINGSFMETRVVIDTIDKVSRFTMVCRENLVELARHVYAAIELGISGDFVECGAWRGGAGFLMADLLRQAGVGHRKVWLFDSYEGLPPPQPIDGPAADAGPGCPYIGNTIFTPAARS
jgi:O-methyltransferase